jgi:hypothetical protein
METVIDRPPRVTRQGLAKILTEQGYPTTASSLAVYACRNEGPPIEGKWGDRPMYCPIKGLKWAEARFKPYIRRIA